jgi:hypothetical protein
MTSRTRLIAALLGGVALLAVVAIWLLMPAAQTPEEKGWPPSERAGFMSSCIQECRKSPGVTEDKYPLCDQACGCAADEGEKIMTARELETTAAAISGGNASAEQTAKMDRLKAAGAKCAAVTAPAKQ